MKRMPPLLLLDNDGLQQYTDYNHSNPSNSVRRAAFTFHDGFVKLSGSTDSVSLRLNNVSYPSEDQDAANKTYVDTVVKQTIDGLHIKQSVAAASTEEISLTSLVVGLVIDGYTLALQDRVLLKDQVTDPTQNGIWQITTLAAERPDDFASGFRASGSYAFVDRGVAHMDKSFVCVTNKVDGFGTPNDIVDSSALQFNTYSVRPAALAGEGLEVDGTSANRMQVDHDVVPYRALPNTFTGINTFESRVVVTDHIETPYVSVPTAIIPNALTNVINREYHERSFNEFQWKQPVITATAVHQSLVANYPSSAFMVFASTHTSSVVFRPRGGGQDQNLNFIDEILTAGGTVDQWGADDQFSYDQLYFTRFPMVGSAPVYNEVKKAVVIDGAFLPLSDNAAVNLVNQTLMVAAQIPAGGTPANKILLGYGGAGTDLAQVVSELNGGWSIRYENASGTIVKKVPISIPTVAEEQLVTSQEHIFVLAFTYLRDTDDFRVRFQWTNTDGTVLVGMEGGSSGVVVVSSNNTGTETGWPETPNFGIHPFALGHTHDPVDAAIKDVRIFDAIQPSGTFNAQFNSMLDLLKETEITPSNLLTEGSIVDDVTLVAGDRVLLLNQRDPVENGIFIVSPGNLAPERSPDADTSVDLSGSVIVAMEGTLNASKAYVCTTPGPALVDSSSLSFALIGSSPQQLAGATGSGIVANLAGGLAINVDGTTVEVRTDNNQLQVKGGLDNAMLGDKPNTFHEVNSFVSGEVSTSKGTGSIVVSNGGGLGIDGAVHCENVIVHATTPSSNQTSGSLQIAGGVGVQGDLHCEATVMHATTVSTDQQSGTLQVAGGVGVQGDLHCHATVVHATTTSMDQTSGALQVAGGVGVQGDLHCEATVVHASTASTDQTSGALRVAGGVGVQGDIHCEATVVHANTASIDQISGALQVAGGVGVQGDLHCEATVVHASTASTDQTSGALQVAGGVGVQGDLHCEATVMHATTASTSQTTGALQVAGGVGVQGDIQCFASIVNASTASTSRSTGALRVEGGVGIKGDTHVGSGTESTGPTTGALTVNGGAGISGPVHCTGLFNYSDINLKEELVPLQGALESITQLTGYSFNWKASGRSDIGVVAQEVAAMDERCTMQGDYLSVDYTRLVPYLLEAIKAVNQKADSLKRQLDLVTESQSQSTKRQRTK